MVYTRTQESLVERMKLEYVNVGGLTVNFQRTCRVPVGKQSSLPAGLGSFPVYKVKDFKSGAPKNWKEDGYFMPMYKQEAMWMNFCQAYAHQPKALIVGAGNINAVTGIPFDPSKKIMGKKQDKKDVKKGELDIKLESVQNYLVVPPQPWLDGWKAEDGLIYQFVAAEMGSGQTVEGQITGEEKAGGIQLIVYDSKHPLHNHSGIRRFDENVLGVHEDFFFGDSMLCESSLECFAQDMNDAPSDGLMKCYASPIAKGMATRGASRSITSMGLGRGGEIIQHIYPDTYGLNVWNQNPTAVEMVYLVSSEDFKQLTGCDAPATPVTYEKYNELHLPWFNIADQHMGDTKGSNIFSKLKPVEDGKSEVKK